jgi:putative addiction module CopG family antidote
VTELNIQLPDDAGSFVHEQVAAGKSTSVSEYILLLVERERQQTAHERVERLLLEGLDSGPAMEVSREWWLQKADEWAAKHSGDSSR